LKKILFVVLDGLGDRPNAKLGGRTPLEAADTPHLDELAQKGETGLMDTIGPGIAPESDAAVMSILGYDVDEFYTGRGPLESHGSGMQVPDGSLAWRCNFGTVEPDHGRLPEGAAPWRIVDRRVGRNLTDPEARELAAAVQEDVSLEGATFEFRHSIGHRACLVIQSIQHQLSGDVDNCDPAYRRQGAFSVALEDPGTHVMAAKPLRDSTSARLGAELTNEFMRKSFEVLDGHPVNQRRRAEGKMPGNFVLARDAGDRLPRLPSFQQRYGIHFGALVEMPVEIGLAQLTGMGEVHVMSTAEEPDKGLADWADKTLGALQRFDGLYVHLKGPDLFGHDGDAEGKAACIESIDRLYFGPLVRALRLPDMVIAVTADHSTPCDIRAHSADPVPLLISSDGLEPEGALQFGESEATHGRLGKLRGPELVPRLVEIART
jgi:2,3-bisphosphoglycerate-independent phosphoglycerate mutase